MTLGSLFDGIGGFPLAASRHGIKTLWASEIEAFPMEVTRLRFPHAEIVLDNGLEVCDNNEYKTEITGPIEAVKYIPGKLFRLIRQRCRGKPKIGEARWPITLCPTFMGKRTAFMRC